MLILSPSKGQDLDTPAPQATATIPEFLDQAERLVNLLRAFDTKTLRELMGISDTLARQNRERFVNFSTPFSTANAKQALFTFTGDVYTSIAAEHYTGQQLTFAQENLRILSGLYGCLRPLDLIQPYRLEMKTQLPTDRGGNLYAFWGSRITESLSRAIQRSGQPYLINLASGEYVRAIKKTGLDVPVIEVLFREVKEGKSRTIAIHAKRARGMLTDYILQNRLTSAEDIKAFTGGGYSFAPDLSGEQVWVFTRPQP